MDGVPAQPGPARSDTAFDGAAPDLAERLTTALRREGEVAEGIDRQILAGLVCP